MGPQDLVREKYGAWNRAVALALDISNAHNTFDREASIEALSSFADADGGLRSLPRAWHAITFQKNPIFVRDIDAANGWSYLCESAAVVDKATLSRASPLWR